MDSNGADIPTQSHPLHHHHRHRHRRPPHHHHFFISPHCPLHRSILQPENHSPSCSFPSARPSLENPKPLAPAPPNFSFPINQPNPTSDDALVMQDEVENLEVEEEGDPVFVLTDEWRDFFAKSEAKRKLAKKSNKGKN